MRRWLVGLGTALALAGCAETRPIVLDRDETLLTYADFKAQYAGIKELVTVACQSAQIDRDICVKAIVVDSQLQALDRAFQEAVRRKDTSLSLTNLRQLFVLLAQFARFAPLP